MLGLSCLVVIIDDWFEIFLVNYLVDYGSVVLCIVLGCCGDGG